MSEPEIVTFGCRLNAYESEVMRAAAEKAGLENAIIFNTCAVTAEATRQARQAIRRARREHPDARIIVTGCAAQTDPKMFAAMPEVDLVLGNSEKLDAEELSPPGFRRRRRRARQGQRHHVGARDGAPHDRRLRRARPAPSCRSRTAATIAAPSASFPSAAAIRARSRRATRSSRSAASSPTAIREIVLSGVDITSWGADLPGQPRLGNLVRRILKAVPELKRLRLSSIDSIEADDELMRAIAEEERLMPHLHLSLQAGDDMILKRMKRRHLARAFDRLLRRGAAAAARHRLRRRPHRRLSDRDRRDVRATR